jgi:protocatechuate 3,4-dioxygenase beta subunit
VLGVVAALVLGGAGPLWGQEDARVLGRVTDGVGNPVAEARVTLVPEGAAAAGQETVSGQTGGFQFAGVAPGTYTLRATRAGYTVQERRVTVRPGQVTSHVVRLQRGRAAREVANALRPIGR